MAQGRSNLIRKLIAIGLVTVGAALVTWAAATFQLFEEVESTTWDARLRYIAGQIPPDPKIRIIMIDQSSLDHFSRDEKIFWPWPRSLYAPVIKFLEAGGAKAVAFDILFTEPSSYGVEDDQVFASSMSSSVKVVMASALRNAELSERSEEIELFRRKIENAPDFAIAQAAISSMHKPTHFISSTIPIREFIQSSSALGNVSSSPDFDGVFRHTTPGGIVHGIPVLSLPFALYNVSSLGALSSTYLRDMSDEQGRLTLRFSGPARSYKTDPIAAIIRSISQIEAGERPLIDPRGFKDAIVFVGMDAPGLLDLRPTPLSEVYPGVEFNATVLDNLANRRFIRKASLSTNILTSAALAAIAAAATFFLTGLALHLIALTSIAGIYVSLLFYAATLGWWVMMAVPLFTAALVVTLCLAYQYQLEGRQHRFLRHAFRHYVSSTVIDRIVEDPSSLAIGGERRELTIFFSDIEGFTSISESLEAGKLVQLLNIFLSEMAKIILATGGTVDKYVGDAVVAFWNAPVAAPDHAKRGVEAALRCQQRLSELKDTFQKDFGKLVRMRIGLHTGVVSVGNFGSEDRFTYTMIGDAANLASRLEGANKYFGTYVMASGDTVSKLPANLPRRKIADIIVVGRRTATSVYEPLLGVIDSTRQKELEKFQEALQIFERGELERARDIFVTIAKDPVARRYVSRIERDLKRPADGRPWDPVWNLTEK